ncbi:hypothetical protein ACLOJK_035716 [Asimina triloba]
MIMCIRKVHRMQRTVGAPNFGAPPSSPSQQSWLPAKSSSQAAMMGAAKATGDVIRHQGSDERRTAASSFSIFGDGRSEILKTHLVGRQRHGMVAARQGNGRQSASSSNLHKRVTGEQRLTSHNGSGRRRQDERRTSRPRRQLGQATNGGVDPLFHDGSRQRAHGNNQSTAQIPTVHSTSIFPTNPYQCSLNHTTMNKHRSCL